MGDAAVTNQVLGELTDLGKLGAELGVDYCVFDLF